MRVCANEDVVSVWVSVPFWKGGARSPSSLTLLRAAQVRRHAAEGVRGVAQRPDVGVAQVRDGLERGVQRLEGEVAGGWEGALDPGCVCVGVEGEERCRQEGSQRLRARWALT